MPHSAQTVLKQIARVQKQLVRLEKMLNNLNSLRPVFYFSVPYPVFDYLEAMQSHLIELEKTVSSLQNEKF